MTDEQTEELKEQVGIAVGRASMCWNPIPTGVFDSTAAGEVKDKLVARILAFHEPIVPANWEETAAQYARNADYYKALVVEIGKMFGKAAYISDDGSKQEDVLCAKVPELVRQYLYAIPKPDCASEKV